MSISFSPIKDEVALCLVMRTDCISLVEAWYDMMNQSNKFTSLWLPYEACKHGSRLQHDLDDTKKNKKQQC